MVGPKPSPTDLVRKSRPEMPDKSLLKYESANIGRLCEHFAESEIVMVDGTFFDDSVEQDRSWDISETTISGIEGTHQNSIRVRMSVLIVVPRVNSTLGSFRANIIDKLGKISFCSQKYCFPWKKKTAGLHHTESQSDDAPQLH